MHSLLLLLAVVGTSLAIQCHVTAGVLGTLPSSDDLQPCPDSNFCFSQYINNTLTGQVRAFGCDYGNLICPGHTGCSLSINSANVAGFKVETDTYTCCCASDGCNYDFNSGRSDFGVFVISVFSFLVSVVG